MRRLTGLLILTSISAAFAGESRTRIEVPQGLANVETEQPTLTEMGSAPFLRIGEKALDAERKKHQALSGLAPEIVAPLDSQSEVLSRAFLALGFTVLDLSDHPQAFLALSSEENAQLSAKKAVGSMILRTDAPLELVERGDSVCARFGQSEMIVAKIKGIDKDPVFVIDRENPEKTIKLSSKPALVREGRGYRKYHTAYFSQITCAMSQKKTGEQATVSPNGVSMRDTSDPHESLSRALSELGFESPKSLKTR